jgi:hypothetical protein
LTDFDDNGAPVDNKEIQCGQVAKPLSVDELQACIAKANDGQSALRQISFMDSNASQTLKRPLDQTPDSHEEAEEVAIKHSQPHAKQCKGAEKGGGGSLLLTFK